MTRYAARVDNNHADLVADITRLGWAVADLSRAGEGWPDLMVSIGPAIAFPPDPKIRGVVTSGEAYFVEVKSKDGKLTKPQQEWAWLFRGPLIVAECVEDVIEGVRVIRAARKIRGER